MNSLVKKRSHRPRQVFSLLYIKDRRNLQFNHTGNINLHHYVQVCLDNPVFKWGAKFRLTKGKMNTVNGFRRTVNTCKEKVLDE